MELAPALAHPECMTAKKAKSKAHLVGRSAKNGVNSYRNIDVIDIETCEALKETALNLLELWTKKTDGTTDDESVLRGLQFPGCYITRTTHIQITAQTNITNGTSYSTSKLQHIGQLFVEENHLSQMYALEPYSAHLSTLNHTINAEDSLYSDASADGYSAVISVSQLTDNIEDALVGYLSTPGPLHAWHKDCKMVRLVSFVSIFAVVSSVTALRCTIEIRNSVGAVVGSTCITAGQSGSVKSIQSGATYNFNTSEFCGVGATNELIKNESLSKGGPC
ncbi:hypothetical protein CTRI78_v010033 [Colletotrichum trifolii]|uniref:ToxB-like N-terminal ascomycota domain-containing protein n=1 Tax=Colletotrichum trifolii TaxID=5466 RepID=A0A4R8QP41_COLTR|nr:hypothetical protein CTRI78_v010033 [Colletotrichum trifolii]